MKVGIGLHSDRGHQVVLEEARQADLQGFDSVWLNDHMMGLRTTHSPVEPLDSFTLMTTIGAQTSRVRLAWGMLNPSFRPAAVLAKMLATLDVLTAGRVICSIGAGWLKEEYLAYGVSFLDDHDERIAHEREVIQLLKQAWSHPAPERITFEGRYVKVQDLPFNPAPCQQPHPPIWIGGDSPATVELVKELADGWVMLNPQSLAIARAAADWPRRPLTLMRTFFAFVDADSRQSALEQALAYHAEASARPGPRMGSAEEFVARALIGTPDQCVLQLAELEAGGLNYVRLLTTGLQHQAQLAELLLPRVAQL